VLVLKIVGVIVINGRNIREDGSLTNYLLARMK
jgi:hypothetical protein